MSTIVFQNILSSFQPETTTTLELKLAPPPPSDYENLEFGSWGSLSDRKTGENHPNYSPKNHSKLTAKSLELCTENLGSETGTDIMSDSGSGSIFRQPPSAPKSARRQRYCHRSQKVNDFPPPLTSSSSLQVRRHSEGGRLIIEAVEAPFRNSYLTAERSGGRLRLCFLRAGGEESSDEDVGPDTSDVEIDEEINLEMEKLWRVSRCKQGSHGLWKPALWVAT